MKKKKVIIEEYYENGMCVEILQNGAKLFYKNGKLVKHVSSNGSVSTFREDEAWNKPDKA